MRLIATSDTHFPFDSKLIPDGDVFILAGDMMYEGTTAEWKSRVESLAALPHKRKIYVPGNHDYFPYHYRGLARSQLRREAGVTMLDESDPQLVLDGKKFLGIPFVTGLRGWAYPADEAYVYSWIKAATENFSPDVIISHAPPYKILDSVQDQHYGCMAFNKWFYKPGAKPEVWISGHIHDSYGATKKDDCWFFNVAMCNENYEQVNAPRIIDL